MLFDSPLFGLYALLGFAIWAFVTIVTLLILRAVIKSGVLAAMREHTEDQSRALGSQSVHD